MHCPKCGQRAESIELKQNEQKSLELHMYCTCGYSGLPRKKVTGQQALEFKGGDVSE